MVAPRSLVHSTVGHCPQKPAWACAEAQVRRAAQAVLDLYYSGNRPFEQDATPTCWRFRRWKPVLQTRNPLVAYARAYANSGYCGQAFVRPPWPLDVRLLWFHTPGRTWSAIDSICPIYCMFGQKFLTTCTLYGMLLCGNTRRDAPECVPPLFFFPGSSGEWEVAVNRYSSRSLSGGYPAA